VKIVYPGGSYSVIWVLGVDMTEGIYIIIYRGAFSHMCHICHIGYRILLANTIWELWRSYRLYVTYMTKGSFSWFFLYPLIPSYISLYNRIPYCMKGSYKQSSRVIYVIYARVCAHVLTYALIYLIVCPCSRPRSHDHAPHMGPDHMVPTGMIC